MDINVDDGGNNMYEVEDIGGDTRTLFHTLEVPYHVYTLIRHLQRML